MVTIYDVANKAGVSPSTVSRVLNNKDNVHKSTKEKVLKVCNELNYVPNLYAGSLKKKSTQTLGIVVPNIDNPFYISILKGFEESSIKNGYNTIICNTEQSIEKEKKYIDMILQKRIDGVAFCTTSENSTHIKKIINKEVAFTLIDRNIENLDVDIVCGDSYEGAIKLINHLINLGHTKIAMVTAPLHLSTSRDRVKGYKKALKKANIPFDPELLKIEPSKSAGFSRSHAYNMTKELIKAEKKFSAVFVANNFMALGVYKALISEGIQVPEDISLVCFDDLSLDFQIDPFFTLMKQPAYTMGQIAADLLLNQIKGLYEKNKQKIVLKPKLVIRKSCAPKK